jgi:hypothetical protein
MVQFLSYDEATKVLENIPIQSNSSSLENKLHWISIMMIITGTSTLEGLLFYQTNCRILKLLPVIGDYVDDYMSIPLCTLIALSTMTLSSVSINELVNVKYPFGETSPAIDNQYNHYSNLTAWRNIIKNSGLDIHLLHDANSFFYEEDDYLYGINATSKITGLNDSYVLLQHGSDASRIFVFENAQEEPFIEGYYYDWCHNNNNKHTINDLIDKMSDKVYNNDNLFSWFNYSNYNNEWMENEICNRLIN